MATGTIQLFHTCLVNEVDPDVGMAVVSVLERAGVRVEVPLEQTCCGQPAFNAGFHEEARQVARHTLGLLSRTAGPIVVPSGSCGDMLVHQYPVLFQDDPEWLAIARAVAARVREFSQFLSEVAPNGVGGTLDTRVAYHPSCHLLRGLGVSQQPATQLASISGAQSVPFKDQEECCGFGGLFSIKNADISGRMLARKADAIDACGADRVVSCDLGCLMQIGGGLHRRGSPVKVQHLAQLLDEAQS
jgi:L-lactate dehydrogenase complex protein LldE